MKILSLLLLAALFINANQHHAAAQQEERRARLFDSFEWVYSEGTSARLDNFALDLQNEQDVAGYVICYGPEGQGSGTGSYLTQAAHHYLVDMRGIEPERLRVVYGGRYKNSTKAFSELWAVPHGVAAPEPKRYKNNLAQISGKFAEYEAWDGFPDGAGGVSSGHVTLAAFADVLRQQPEAVAYVVAHNLRSSALGTWRRVARREASDLQGYGVEAARIKIIFGGVDKKRKDEGSQTAIIRLWVLPGDAAPPVAEAPPERTPKEAVRVGTYDDYVLKYPDNERRVFDGFADVLRADEELSVCFIVRARSEVGERRRLSDEPPDIELPKLIERWKAGLVEKSKIDVNRVTVMQVAADEFNEGTVEVWVIPPGAQLPNPYASPDGEI